MTTTVNDIEHIESQSLNGIAVIKVFFQPHVNIGNAVAQITADQPDCSSASCRPGTTPPFIIQYNASSVPVMQLGLSGQGLNEQQLNDLGHNIIRTQLATVEGAQTSPIPMAASSARSRWISTCTRCRPRASRPPMWSTPSTRRTSFCPPAP